MRAVLAFWLAIAGTMLAVAVLARPLYTLAHAIDPDWVFNKVMSRSWQLAMLVAIGLVIRRLGLAGRADWGYGLPQREFLRQFALALALGVLTMLPVAAAMIVLDLRPPGPGVDTARLLHLLLSGCTAGLAVALFEETLYRGLMFTAVRREAGIRLAVASTALIYAATHFLAKTRIPAGEPGWDAGFTMLAGTLRAFADPAGIADAFAALLLIGVLLALARHWTGAIATSLGLHAGWVWVLKVTVGLTQPPGAAPHAALVSRFDGFTGWLVAGWTLCLILVLTFNRKRLRGLRDPHAANV
ncbi:MAG: CPBP family intramembrane glutamic endopeptidase [Steroidobacteraceae bacterium]